MQAVGLKVSDVVVLIDREQGGGPRLASHGLSLHSAFTLTFILETMLQHGKIDPRTAASVKEFIATNQTFDQQNIVKAPAASAPRTSR